MLAMCLFTTPLFLLGGGLDDWISRFGLIGTFFIWLFIGVWLHTIGAPTVLVCSYMSGGLQYNQSLAVVIFTLQALITWAILFFIPRLLKKRGDRAVSYIVLILAYFACIIAPKGF